jgi:8-oxo-dGTP diphosphatase/A/G-specific adenine glycosylase
VGGAVDWRKQRQGKDLKQVDVAIGIVVRDGLVLIAQRKAQGHLAGFWEFPGGKREPDELIEHCLHRELKEELDLEVAISAELPAIEHQYAEVHVTLRPFVCRWTAGEGRAIACQQFLWVSPGELGQYEFPPANAELIEWVQRNVGVGEGETGEAGEYGDGQEEVVDHNQELDALRIRQVARARQAAMRFRSYFLVGAGVCAVGAIDLLWRVISRLREPSREAAFYLPAAGVLAWMGWRLSAKANRVGREAMARTAPEPTAPPDFSTLSDGSHIVRNLEKLQ